jgi:hypothetical protein
LHFVEGLTLFDIKFGEMAAHKVAH